MYVCLAIIVLLNALQTKCNLYSAGFNARSYAYCICNIVENLPSLNQPNQPDIWSQPTEPMYFVFCRLYPSSLQPTRVCARLLSVISLNLTNTVSPVRACLSKWLERFRGTQKEDERGSVTSVCKFLDGLNTFVLAPEHLGSIPGGTRSRSDA